MSRPAFPLFLQTSALGLKFNGLSESKTMEIYESDEERWIHYHPACALVPTNSELDQDSPLKDNPDFNYAESSTHGDLPDPRGAESRQDLVFPALFAGASTAKEPRACHGWSSRETYAALKRAVCSWNEQRGFYGGSVWWKIREQDGWHEATALFFMGSVRVSLTGDWQATRTSARKDASLRTLHFVTRDGTVPEKCRWAIPRQVQIHTSAVVATRKLLPLLRCEAYGCDLPGRVAEAFGGAVSFLLHRDEETHWYRAILGIAVKIGHARMPLFFCGAQRQTGREAKADVAIRAFWFKETPGYDNFFELPDRRVRRTST